MVTVLSPPEQRIVLYNVSWQTYECLLRDYENSSSPRLTYDHGILEIMSPFSEHESYCRFIDLVLGVWADETDIRVRITGATTFKRRALLRGFEPDSSFYIQNEPAVRGKRRIDLEVDPPPDLVIEIDITHSSLDKLSINAQVGVPEVWRYDGQKVEVLVLNDEGYVPQFESRMLPGMTAAALADLLTDVPLLDAAAWMRRARHWARSLPDAEAKPEPDHR